MTKQLALNLATLYPRDLEQKLYAAGAAGFRAVGMLLSDLAREGEAGLMELRLSQLAVAELVGLTGWADLDRATRTVALHHAEQAFELAAKVRAALVVAEAPVKELDDLALADWFGELCRVAQPYGVRVGLEFSGWAELVKDVASAWRVVENAGLDNGGLVIDTFHFHKGGSSVEMLEPVPGEKVYLVQIADCLEMPRHEMENRHRIYPGAGAIPFEPLLAALYDMSYAGYYSLELYNEDYWLEDPIVVAKDAMRSMRQL
jgi:sugar phosphate isomerase/epimerase